MHFAPPLRNDRVRCRNRGPVSSPFDTVVAATKFILVMDTWPDEFRINGLVVRVPLRSIKDSPINNPGGANHSGFAAWYESEAAKLGGIGHVCLVAGHDRIADETREVL